MQTEQAILAAGCFWGVEYYFKKLPGILTTEVGYSGGTLANPTYRDVCEHRGGHMEVIRVSYDPLVVSYLEVLKYFFEIHDFTQYDGQGPDIGPQYQSAIFCYDEEQKTIANKIILQLQDRGYKVATTVFKASTFWVAEKYHQDYYQINQKEPYCHFWQKKF
jgi:peptide methionine sulfoxide reductase msrA/msrB